jgi:hypothetical protein
MRSGRKFPAEARQRQPTLVTAQLSSWLESMQSCTHCGKEETNWDRARGMSVRIAKADLKIIVEDIVSFYPVLRLS